MVRRASAVRIRPWCGLSLLRGLICLAVRALPALALVGGSLGGGCSTSERTDNWGELKYHQGDVWTLEEQLEAQRALQADPSSMTDAHQPRQEKYFSQKMTEKERRAFQEREAKRLHERVEKQRQGANRQVQQAVRAQSDAKSGRLDQ